MNVVLTLIINVLMAGLLLATMVYCRRLNARVKVLQDSKSELAHIIREFDESTQRATQSIADIHTATARLSDNIQHKIDKANFLADDLQYMIDKGQKLTGKVDTTPARPARNEAPAAPAAAPAPKSSAFIMPDLPSGSVNAGPRPAAATSELGAAAMARPGAGRMRSRAEQEIMTALGGNKPTTGE